MKLNSLSRIIVLTSLAAMISSESPAQTNPPRTLSQLPPVPGRFDGKYYRGHGDVEYLQLLEVARRMFEPDPELQNLSMLYTPDWNGLVEGPTWRGWWIQNSYGTTYSILPLLREPFVTFLQNSQDLWFDQMGDGERVGAPPPHNWVAPNGALCDGAEPGKVFYKQGDGRIAMHDWAMEFTAAGVVMQGELLLIGRDPKAIERYLPKLERAVTFVETRRNPANNLFLAGPAANLLGPSYAGFLRPDGTYDKAYLAGLSITHIAALDRLIELEKLTGHTKEVEFYTNLRDSAKRALALLTTSEGYFVKSIDPDGARHGVLYADKYGYFEAPPNHDAIAFRVADDAQAEKIYRKIASLRGLRPHDFILPNYPSYDDMYEKTEGLWTYGRWVNGGHWSSCEARMMLGYYRLGQFEDARKSMRRLRGFASQFRLDNPLTKFGSKVYQAKEPINLTYDAFGPAAAFMRGLFEYLYRADGLTLLPHVPTNIVELEQLDPVRFGQKKIYLSTCGSGPVTGVKVNGKPWNTFDLTSVLLPYNVTPEVAHVQILLGDAKGLAKPPQKRTPERPAAIEKRKLPEDLALLDQRATRLREFCKRLAKAKLAESYEAAHAQLAVDCIAMIHRRRQLQSEGRLKQLPEPSQSAADKSYLDAAVRLCDGLEAALKKHENAGDPNRTKIWELWLRAGK